MTELRLVPTAVVAWLCTLVVLWSRTPWWAVIVAALGAVTVMWWDRGQAIAVAVGGASISIGCWLRVLTADTAQFGREITARVSTAMQEVRSGWMFRARVPGFPEPIPVLLRKPIAGLTPGTEITMTGTATTSRNVGLGRKFFFAEDIKVIHGPDGIYAISAFLRARFNDRVTALADSPSQGLIPAMIMGDTSLQSAEEKQEYIATGLAHLSAVSGGNVTILTTTVMSLLAVCGCSPRIRRWGAGSALVAFVCVVGPEPSVLRASVMGGIGLIAAMNASRTPPIHALCLAVICLLLWEPGLAAHYGFALSVGATAGIIALCPLIYRPLARANLRRKQVCIPDIILRSIAVAVAAELVTVPLVAMMAGRISLVSVPANIIAAPVVPLITVIGLAAVALVWIPPIDWPVIQLLDLLASWIGIVAHWCSSWRGSTLGVPMPESALLGTLWVTIAAVWVLLAFQSQKAWPLGIALLVAAPVIVQTPREVDYQNLRIAVVETADDAEAAPTDIDLIVVKEKTKPHKRPVMRRDGIPVLFPHGDGNVALLVDGTQKAADGHF
ncbi:competence protein ComE [Corynebacterium pseudotuberculosis]|uniref:ComEC/Rec2 family competence protein n=1 Tax=Corynebacterium pseudotuberculosis TaxID=1719 RepID=UPI000737C380|nr:ComEC/Rec2 family competence protein [Corynebacterium pseudotuberculosis]ALU21944.1 competence protein ComE [Corynebacterium pseudotuberculosis]ANH24263.1 Competence protein ComE-like protein [Corynebacterium pseudotuberculosis]